MQGQATYQVNWVVYSVMGGMNPMTGELCAFVCVVIYLPGAIADQTHRVSNGKDRHQRSFEQTPQGIEARNVFFQWLKRDVDFSTSNQEATQVLKDDGDEDEELDAIGDSDDEEDGVSENEEEPLVLIEDLKQPVPASTSSKPSAG